MARKPKNESQKSRDSYTYMTETPVEKLILTFSVPSMIATLITSIYNLSDTFFVSQIGTEATAAVGVVFSINMVLLALGFWVGTGSSTLVSNLLGAHENEKAQRIVSSSFWLSIGAGLLVALVCLISGDRLLVLLGATETILPYAKEYAFWIILSAPITASSLMLGQNLRAEGLSLESMIGNVLGGVLNIILDPIFIFVLKMGITGAALATAISQLIGWLFLAGCYVTGRTSLKLHIRFISRKSADYRQIITMGFPSLCRHSTNAAANIVLNNVASAFGVAPIAAMSICSRLLFLSNAISGGISNGCQPVIGYAYGNHDIPRIRRAFAFAVKVGMGSMLVFGVIGFLFAGPLIRFFRDDPEVVSYGIGALRMICLALPLSCFNNLAGVLFQILKKPAFSSAISLGRQLVFYIPFLLVLPKLFEEFGVQISGPAADIIVGLLCIPLCLGQLKRLSETSAHPAVN